MRLNYWMAAPLLGTLMATLTGCATYFVRKDCEKTNWFQYGEQLAMQGRRISGDEYLHKCNQAEAKINSGDLDRGFKKGMSVYCTADTAFQTGKKGEFFSEDLCDGPGIREMKRRHGEGVKDYCQVANGKAAGSTGKKYNGICPKDTEVAFLKEFSKGRKNYLNGQIQAKSMEITSLHQQISSTESRKSNLSFQLAALGSGQRVERSSIYDPVSRAYRTEERVIEDQAVKDKRESLMSQIRGVDRDVEQKRDRQSQLQKEISEMTAEMATLE